MHWFLQRPVDKWQPGSANTCSVPPAFGHAQTAQRFDGEVLDPLIVLVMRTTVREGMQ